MIVVDDVFAHFQLVLLIMMKYINAIKYLLRGHDRCSCFVENRLFVSADVKVTHYRLKRMIRLPCKEFFFGKYLKWKWHIVGYAPAKRHSLSL